jgi:hypothetical protein
MGHGQAGGHRSADVQHFGHGQRRVAPEPVRQRFAEQSLHDDVEHTALFADIVDRDNVFVLPQLGRRPGLAQKPALRQRAFGGM